MQMKIDFKPDTIAVEVQPTSLEDEKITLGDIVSGMLTALAGTIKDYMKKHEPSEEDIADVHDNMVHLFNRVLNDVFPTVTPLGFELSDAGVLYAMDMIIHEAYEKGLTFDEAIAEYEKKAQEYVNVRKMS